MKTQLKSDNYFPVGYHKFHKKQVFNFQLNRYHSLGFARYQDMELAGRNVKSLEDWKSVMVDLAETALAENRIMNAAIYYRGAEFYITDQDPDKEIFYDTFLDLFYKAFNDWGIEKSQVPYLNNHINALKIESSGQKKGTILIHGGFDSFIEEFIMMMRYFADNGFDVIGFEGPGQGYVRRKQGIAWDQDWEKPTGAVLDHFGLNDVTLFGLSMGGYLCLRAAAFEERVKRVVASGHAVDYTRIAPRIFAPLMDFFMKREKFMNKQSYKKMAKDAMHHWLINQTMYISKSTTPLEGMKTMFNLTRENQHPEKILQDVLILTGRNDHFIPIKMHNMQLKALTNARSVEDRVFTKEDQAQNHCQVGNIRLSLDHILDWISRKT